MLIISRKKDQKIILADEIEITILEVGRNRVRFGINAPKHIPIHTRLKTSPVPEQAAQAQTAQAQTAQPIDIETQTAPLTGLPAAAGSSKRS